MQGGFYFGSEYPEDRLQQLAAGFNHKSDGTTSEKVSLTDREIDVLVCIKDAMSNEEIAAKLCISHRTVEKHRQNIIKKANIKNLMDLYKFAFEFTKDTI